jgi:hypothetical protein
MKDNSILILTLGSLYVLNLFGALYAKNYDTQVMMGLISLLFAIPLIILLVIENKKK